MPLPSRASSSSVASSCSRTVFSARPAIALCKVLARRTGSAAVRSRRSAASLRPIRLVRLVLVAAPLRVADDAPCREAGQHLTPRSRRCRRRPARRGRSGRRPRRRAGERVAHREQAHERRAEHAHDASDFRPLGNLRRPAMPASAGVVFIFQLPAMITGRGGSAHSAPTCSARCSSWSSPRCTTHGSYRVRGQARSGWPRAPRRAPSPPTGREWASAASSPDAWSTSMDAELAAATMRSSGAGWPISALIDAIEVAAAAGGSRARSPARARRAEAAGAPQERRSRTRSSSRSRTPRPRRTRPLAGGPSSASCASQATRCLRPEPRTRGACGRRQAQRAAGQEHGRAGMPAAVVGGGRPIERRVESAASSPRPGARQDPADRTGALPRRAAPRPVRSALAGQQARAGSMAASSARMAPTRSPSRSSVHAASRC